ncbi:NirD/YgiW/YdeI family stress tolerance protein [Acinetobacter rudis]|uniref:TIGR00156 family protein n=1 Tax=Acinetobacter rudis CIP 110305 TaxID=421052 RepID=S3MYJ6_9GAMM|nr:NirD/YgiW/YdeI family stress tolerance protein [Acinetobacter rudis]EPF71483.1 TIGR00156 family protein [Acinetobacter rudis CIP 110305]
MKIISKFLIAAAVITTTSVAIANIPVNQNVVNQAAVVSLKTVKQALNAKDNTQVELRGNVVKSLGDEKYEFRDQTGSITVEIDHELWQGRPIAANTAITLVGEVDVDYKPTKRVEIDVKSLRF